MITIQREMSEEFISDVLTTAFDGNYGACWYWAEPIPGGGWHIDGDGTWRSVEILDREDDDGSQGPSTVDRDVIEKGIQAILDGELIADYIKQYVVRGVLGDDAGEIDAEAADAIVQVGLFDEIVYG